MVKDTTPRSKPREEDVFFTLFFVCLCGTELVVSVPRKYKLTREQIRCPVCTR